jgi:two-component system response regulator PilR (NtrC family)
VAFSSGGEVGEEDISAWLHRSASAAAPAQAGLPTELPPDGLDLEELISRIEKDLLLKALEKAKWVKKKAARLLHLNTRSFRYRLEKYAIKGGRD